jgi:hypothetical protein
MHANNAAEMDNDLNYLNIAELRALCERYGIPYKICYMRDEKLRASGAIDRKAILLARVREFLRSRNPGQQTVYGPSVVCFDPFSKVIHATDRVFFGQYMTTQKQILKLMKTLTDGAFHFGALSQDVIRDFWRVGEAPTYEQFAKKWMELRAAHTRPKAEWAYLTDLASGMDMKDWPVFRQRKAQEVLRAIDAQMADELQPKA